MPGRAYRPSPYTADDALSVVLGSERLVATASSPRLARLWTREVLATRTDDVDVDAVALLVSELTTNAVVHARTPFTVTVSVSIRALRVEVSDESDVPPEPTTYGMGLRVTDAVSCAWGWLPTTTGKTIWFELPARS